MYEFTSMAHPDLKIWLPLTSFCLVKVMEKYSLFTYQHKRWLILYIYEFTNLMMTHVSLGSIQQAFEFQAVCVTISYHISNLTDNGCKNENSNKIADNCKNIPKKYIKQERETTTLEYATLEHQSFRKNMTWALANIFLISIGVEGCHNFRKLWWFFCVFLRG